MELDSLVRKLSFFVGQPMDIDDIEDFYEPCTKELIKDDSQLLHGCSTFFSYDLFGVVFGFESDYDNIIAQQILSTKYNTKENIVHNSLFSLVDMMENPSAGLVETFDEKRVRMGFNFIHPKDLEMIKAQMGTYN